MQRQTVIVLEKCPDKVECYGSLKRVCEAHPDFVYNTLTRKSYPFTYKEWAFYKVKFNEPSS